ncbi:hypothetical protein HETIRDRAFT_406920 [Heterobasidion irregulare TC 32-1]|uniref:Uncharacterized protein n=1 Tax=Heterobasidion irregulare (strain TC 32-1) TaxID=747525 RepID=W4KN81_HETIT|nr:uncharacterized protein HETIRDRAFT_406920 [Heterobasidion irregulare TC 32-1]ETW87179.1 hypothetical protein HETIRDRAFT_406920 [Heterobasidion irregulare TC 32-1]
MPLVRCACEAGPFLPGGLEKRSRSVQMGYNDVIASAGGLQFRPSHLTSTPPFQVSTIP